MTDKEIWRDAMLATITKTEGNYLINYTASGVKTVCDLADGVADRFTKRYKESATEADEL